MKNPVRTGTTIAFAAAALFATSCKKEESITESAPKAAAPAAPEKATAQPDTPPAAGEKSAKLHCQGANSCKAQGSCKSAANACAGQNGCKGKGFVEVATAEECQAKGGTITNM